MIDNWRKRAGRLWTPTAEPEQSTRLDPTDVLLLIATALVVLGVVAFTLVGGVRL